MKRKKQQSKRKKLLKQHQKYQNMQATFSVLTRLLWKNNCLIYKYKSYLNFSTKAELNGVFKVTERNPLNQNADNYHYFSLISKAVVLRC